MRFYVVRFLALHRIIVFCMAVNALHASESSPLNQQLLDVVKSQEVNVASVQSLVEKKADVNAVDVAGISVLLHGVENSSRKWGIGAAVRYLLDNKADVNAYDPLTRMAALHIIMPLTGFTLGEDLLKVLLAYGADPNQRDFCKETPLFKERVTKNAVKILLAAKASAHVCNSAGVSPAFVHKESNVRRMLIEAGADIGGRDYYGNTFLIRAARLGRIEDKRELHKEAVLLLQRKADIHAVNNKGENALFSALKSRNFPTVCLLVNHGASCNLFDHCEPEEVISTLGEGDEWSTYVSSVFARSQVAAIIGNAVPGMQQYSADIAPEWSKKRKLEDDAVTRHAEKSPADTVAEYCFGEAPTAEQLGYPLHCALQRKDAWAVRLLVAQGAPSNDQGSLNKTQRMDRNIQSREFILGIR